MSGVMLVGLLLPVFLLTALGCVLARTSLLTKGWQGGLNELTAKLLIPAFLFGGSYRNGLLRRRCHGKCWPPSSSRWCCCSWRLPCCGAARTAPRAPCRPPTRIPCSWAFPCCRKRSAAPACNTRFR
ncbi:hypothetical protein LP420_18830 [Massilia sp. B-10]|nr:hypothetical protein LP420_18830 [Massilia sp. B-10]